MTYHAILFAPLLVLLPGAAAVEPRRDLAGDTVVAPVEVGEAAFPGSRLASPPLSQPADALDEKLPFRRVAESFREQAARQVRIEQRITIRISPRPQPVRPNMLMALPSREIGPHFLERKIGKCVKASGITGVQPNGGNRLLLFMRDQRIVSAELERSCRSRDFYSGFYLAQNGDGLLCVDRDTLLSRNGSNCKLSRMRQLVEVDE